jgi:hypothetical protein
MLVCAVIDDSDNNESVAFQGNHCVSKRSHGAHVKCVGNIMVIFNNAHVVPLFKLDYGQKSGTCAIEEIMKTDYSLYEMYKKAKKLAHRALRLHRLQAKSALSYNNRTTSFALDHLLG